MNAQEKVSDLFKRIRDYNIEKFDMHPIDAASDLQEFMRDFCREYDNESYEWKSISSTKTLHILREHFRQTKLFYKQFIQPNKS